MSHLEDLVAQQADVLAEAERRIVLLSGAVDTLKQLQAAQTELIELLRTQRGAHQVRINGLVHLVRQLAGELERVTARADLPQDERVRIENDLLELAATNLEGHRG